MVLLPAYLHLFCHHSFRSFLLYPIHPVGPDVVVVVGWLLPTHVVVVSCLRTHHVFYRAHTHGSVTPAALTRHLHHHVLIVVCLLRSIIFYSLHVFPVILHKLFPHVISVMVRADATSAARSRLFLARAAAAARRAAAGAAACAAPACHRLAGVPARCCWPARAAWFPRTYGAHSAAGHRLFVCATTPVYISRTCCRPAAPRFFCARPAAHPSYHLLTTAGPARRHAVRVSPADLLPIPFSACGCAAAPSARALYLPCCRRRRLLYLPLRATCACAISNPTPFPLRRAGPVLVGRPAGWADRRRPPHLPRGVVSTCQHAPIFYAPAAFSVSTYTCTTCHLYYPATPSFPRAGTGLFLVDVHRRVLLSWLVWGYLVVLPVARPARYRRARQIMSYP